MNQRQRREYLIGHLIGEKKRYEGMEIPEAEQEQKMLLRSLMNVREAASISTEFEEVQNAYLLEENERKGFVTIEDMEDCGENLYLWQGDITRIRADAIVNAANSGMTGCYRPCHNCIDNCIHTYAGIQLRNLCSDIMEEQGFAEPTGQAKITPAFNLPAKYVIHTVGPVVEGPLRKKHRQLLASCYRSILELAEENGVESIAFCCISTGVFMFPADKAAQIAVDTVRQYREEKNSRIKVIFNVFKDSDYEIYRRLLGE